MARQQRAVAAEEKIKERRKDKRKGRSKRLRDRSKENQGKEDKVFMRQAKVLFYCWLVIALSPPES